MARQSGVIKITGTIGNICFYKLYDNYYARTKSTLDGKRVKTSAAFKETMRYAGHMATASVIGSEVYGLLPKQQKGRKVYQHLTGQAMLLLKEGVGREEVTAFLKVAISGALGDAGARMEKVTEI